jgi:hypothetical protein
MNRRWALVVALFASACGGVFEASSSGDKDSGLDAPAVDGAGDALDGGTGSDAGSRDDGSADGGGGRGMEGGGGTADGGRGGTDGGSAKDAGSEDADRDAATWSSVCPATTPALHSMCAVDGLQCEYPRAVYDNKLQYDVACDNVLECSDGGWSSAPLGGAKCEPDSPNSTDCPLTFVGITNGGSCSDPGLRCEYPKGVCTCAAALGGVLPVLDAGASWSCNPETGCPMPRPRLGSACGTAKQSCTYQSCSFGEICEAGVWQGEPEACAASGP